MDLTEQSNTVTAGAEESPSKGQHTEVVIDIHVRHLKMKVTELATDNDDGESKVLPVRIIWSRGKKQAKTQYKNLTKEVDMAVFDEKF